MAVAIKTITGTWQAITTAGQSGSVWPVEIDSLAGRKGQADVVIYHTTGAAPTGDNNLTESKKLYESNGNNDMMLLTADNASDIFYARCITEGSEAKINVDVV